MNRTLKTMFLLLFISSISFLSAQEGRDSEKKSSKSLVKDKDGSLGKEVETTDGPNAAVSPRNKPAKAVNVGQPDGKPTGKKKNSAEDKKGWLARLFAKKSDPN